ncbi:MAG: hypothetical protein K6G91_11450 [Kiritimatiellae bacterium]|nr:hypothetical protein [Kiritimatiellia bacterium]
MKLPTYEEWTNDKFVETVMKAKGWDRERAVVFLEEKYRCMEEPAKNGASDSEIAEAGMPLTSEEIFALVFSDALKKQCT